MKMKKKVNEQFDKNEIFKL